MQTNSLNRSPEIQDVPDSEFLDQSSFDHIRSDCLNVEKHLKSAIDALKWLHNNQQTFFQSSTQPKTRPLWRELRKLAMNACVFPLEHQALALVFGRVNPSLSEDEVEIFAKFRHLMYEPKRGLSFRARVRSHAYSSESRPKDLKYALPGALSDVAVLFLRSVLQNEVTALQKYTDGSCGEPSLHSISEFKRVSAAYSHTNGTKVRATAAALDVAVPDTSSVKRDARAKILRAFMRAKNTKLRARFEQDATAAGWSPVQKRDGGNELQPLLLAWNGPTNLKAEINKLNRKKLDVSK